MPPYRVLCAMSEERSGTVYILQLLLQLGKWLSNHLHDSELASQAVHLELPELDERSVERDRDSCEAEKQS